MKIRTSRDLIAWQRGMQLAIALYQATEKMPRSEMFGLTSQIRRAGTSIPFNIAEGLVGRNREADRLGVPSEPDAFVPDTGACGGAAGPGSGCGGCSD